MQPPCHQVASNAGYPYLEVHGFLYITPMISLLITSLEHLGDFGGLQLQVQF